MKEEEFIKEKNRIEKQEKAPKLLFQLNWIEIWNDSRKEE